MKCLLFSLHTRPWWNTSTGDPAASSSAVAMAHRDSGQFVTRRWSSSYPSGFWVTPGEPNSVQMRVNSGGAHQKAELGNYSFCCFVCFAFLEIWGQRELKEWMGSANSQTDWCLLAQEGTDTLWSGDNALESAAVWPPLQGQQDLGIWKLDIPTCRERKYTFPSPCSTKRFPPQTWMCIWIIWGSS